MFWKHKAAVANNWGLLENIKKDIENQLGEKGVMVSEIKIKIGTENISFSITIQGLPVSNHLNTN
jgi:hypothetical protein